MDEDLLSARRQPSADVAVDLVAVCGGGPTGGQHSAAGTDPQGSFSLSDLTTAPAADRADP